MWIIIFLGLLCFFCLLMNSFHELKNNKGYDEIDYEISQEKLKEQKLIRTEFYKLYKQKTKNELEKELSKIEEDYENLADLARKKYERKNKGESAIRINLKNNIVDDSFEDRFVINYALATKYKIISDLLGEGLYAIDTASTDYVVSAYLKYVTKDGIEKRTRYSAKIKFDAEDGDSIGFIYNAPIKKKKKDIGKLAFLLYSYIDKIEASDDDITIYLKHPKTMKKYVEAAISVDCVVKKDNIIIKFETETPKEICKEIKKRLRDIK